MIVNLIVATDKNGCIGKDNTLPWGRVKEDMDFFRRATLGNGNNSVVVGRKTFESFGGKPLPGRFNSVITRSPVDDEEDTKHAYYVSLEECLSESGDDEEVWIIGGAQIYQEAFNLGIVQYVYMTVLEDYEVEGGDTFFRGLPEEFVEIAGCRIKAERADIGNIKFKTFGKVGQWKNEDLVSALV